MKLNFDCVRDGMFALEEDLPLHSIRSIDLHRNSKLSQYSYEEVVHSSMNLEDAKLIESTFKVDLVPQTHAVISKIREPGYRFLEEIRQDSIWNKIKSTSNSVGVSLPYLIEISNEIFKNNISGG